MSRLTEVLLPLFGLMALGFAAVRVSLISEAGVRGLVLFVFNFSIPALLLRSLATMEFPAEMTWGFLGAFYLGSFVVYGAGLALGRKPFARSLADSAIFGMGAAFSNLVLMGIPITLTALGPEASLPMFLIIGFHSATFMPITVALVQADRPDGQVGLRRAGTLVLDVIRNPIILGIAVGALVNFAGTGIWGPADRVLDLLGTAAVPCALFAMGASLACYPLRGDVPPAVGLTILKLVGHPALVWASGHYLFGVGGIELAVAVLLASMPSAVNVYLFGERYAAAPGVAARTVLLTSLGSIVTISVVLGLLGR